MLLLFNITIIVTLSKKVQYHIGAGGRQHHELGVKSNTLDGPGVVTVHGGHLRPRVRAPAVHAAVCGATEHEQRVWTEGDLQGDALRVGVALEGTLIVKP